MKCPQCKSVNDRVANSRHKEDHTIIRRRRECMNCGYRWTTYEFMADTIRKSDNDMIKFLSDDN